MKTNNNINKDIPLRTIHYQWEKLLYSTPKREEYLPYYGYVVSERYNNGKAKKIKFTILVDKPDNEIYLVGNFNDWGKDINKLQEYKLMPEDEYSINYSIEVENIEHKSSYQFLVIENGNKEFRRDPASRFFDDEGNSMFWDFNDPSTYKFQNKIPDTLHRSTKILQTDIFGLVDRWHELYPEKGFSPRKRTEKEDIYKYICECGVLEKVKELGFNAIQFLPIAQSIDGDNWKFRYLVAYHFSIHKDMGDPDSFKQLIDKCHSLGLSIICDIVISHVPYKDFKLFGFKGEDVGIHKWKNRRGQETYLLDETPWGTKRFDYDNPHVRNFLIETIKFFASEYKIDGFRIDNVDGILRFGDSGDGPERPNGRRFLKDLIKAVYKIEPLTIIHLESHYFFNDSAKMLVCPFEEDERSLGATAYNSSRVTYYLHKEVMPKAVENITIWRFKEIVEEKEWGHSNSTIADFHNHDAAAGLMHGRATGSYAYDAMILKNPNLHRHAVGKIKIMEALIGFCLEGRTLNLLQTFLLQIGTFEHDSSIHWKLLKESENKKIVDYKTKVNSIMDHPAFWPENNLYRKYINIDDKNKVLVVSRRDKTQNTMDEFVIVINFSNYCHYNYSVGVDSNRDYEVVLNSDETKYGGDNYIEFKNVLENKKSYNFAHFDREIFLEKLPPYGVIVLRAVK